MYLIFDSIFDSNFTVVLFILAIILMTYQQLTPRYLMGIIILIISLNFSPKLFENKVEHLQVSSEAIQNVGSIYNKNKMIIKDLEVTGNLKVNGPLSIGSWTLKDANEIQFIKNGGGYAVFQPNGNMWTKPTGSYKDNINGFKNSINGLKNSINGLNNWKNFVSNGKGHKRNGDKGYGWNAKKCHPAISGGCTDRCPSGYYMSGISAGKEWDHKHPICTKFT